MASVEELKRMIIDLKVDLVRANIPRDNCPYAYYSTSKKSNRDCNGLSCRECTRKFLHWRLCWQSL